MSLSESAREQIKRMLLANFSLEKIIMFGSQARGTADKRSDVDLLVISNVNKDKFILAREIREALLKLDYAFDIVTFTPEEYDKEKEILGTVSRYAQSGELKSFKLGSRRLFEYNDILSFFENLVDREYVFGKEL